MSVNRANPGRRAISFFIPCFNCAGWIDASAGSILDGNLCDGDELVLVNDGSTDATAGRLAALAEAHPAVRVIEHDRNRGGAAARNTAVRAARHELLYCLDSDNLLPPGTADALAKRMLQQEAQACAPQRIAFFREDDPEQKTTHEVAYPETPPTFADYLSTMHVAGGGGNFLFTRAAYDRAGGYLESSGALDAWGFGLRLAATGSVIAVAPGRHYRHRYAHESYWTRHRKGEGFGGAVLDVLGPWLDELRPTDVRYLRSEQGRREWFLKRAKRPLRLRDPDARGGLGGVVLRTKSRLWRLHAAKRAYHTGVWRASAASLSTELPLRLVLGVGRSGTTWVGQTLAKSPAAWRTQMELLLRLRPKAALGSGPDPAAMPYVERLDADHTMLAAYRAFAGQACPHVPERLRGARPYAPVGVLVKEVHGLLASGALLDTLLEARALFVVRDPIRVADSLFDAQTLEAPYLWAEAESVRSPRFCRRALGVAGGARAQGVFDQIDAAGSPRLKRIGAVAMTVALMQRFFASLAEAWPERVRTVAYESLCADPAEGFRGAAGFLGMAPPEAGEAIGPVEPKPASPYSLARDTSRQLGRAYRFLSADEAAWCGMLVEGLGLEALLCDPPAEGSGAAPADPRRLSGRAEAA
ncbi:MAG: glycosyltransferase family 2 protein [Planctomycetota bacterium]